MPKRLARVKSLPPAVTGKLRQHNVISCRDFFNSSVLELMGVLNYNFSQLQTVTTLVSAATAPTSQTALKLYKEKLEGKNRPLTTALHKLDTVLRGGLSAGTITEIAGPPGCGKTQFCMMISMMAVLPHSLAGRGTRVAYIDTEVAFTAERLVEMAKARYTAHFASPNNLVDLAERVFVFQELTCNAFLRRLEALEEIIASQSIGLIIVDSIASLVRKEFDTSSGRGVADRAALLGAQAARLKYLAEAYQLPVVVTNQITTRLSRDQAYISDWSHKESEVGGEGVLIAALGTSWSHCVNTRLLLEHAEGSKRVLTVAKSPVSGEERVVVNIEDKGLVLDWQATAELHDEGRPGIRRLPKTQGN